MGQITIKSRQFILDHSINPMGWTTNIHTELSGLAQNTWITNKDGDFRPMPENLSVIRHFPWQPKSHRRRQHLSWGWCRTLCGGIPACVSRGPCAVFEVGHEIKPHHTLSQNVVYPHSFSFSQFIQLLPKLTFSHPNCPTSWEVLHIVRVLS